MGSLIEELAEDLARAEEQASRLAIACEEVMRMLAERGTVVAMVAACQVGGQWRRPCWFFAAAKREADALGLALARLIVKYLLGEGDAMSFPGTTAKSPCRTGSRAGSRGALPGHDAAF